MWHQLDTPTSLLANESILIIEQCDTDRLIADTYAIGYCSHTETVGRDDDRRVTLNRYVFELHMSLYVKRAYSLLSDILSTTCDILKLCGGNAQTW